MLKSAHQPKNDVSVATSRHVCLRYVWAKARADMRYSPRIVPVPV